MKVFHALKASLVSIALAGVLAPTASAAPVSLTELTGFTGGTLAGTGVYRADLSGLGLGSILSISIADNSVGLGGSPGAFSGFDLDAIKLSNTFCASAACAAGAAGIGAFDFGAGTSLVPGLQRPPVAPKLFGTDATGLDVDNAVATLGVFDGESTTVIPGAFGFVSLGDNGVVNFNLTSAVSTLGLYLYIGEVGNNGEVAASSVVVRDNRVPEPATLALVGLGLLAVGHRGRRDRRRTGGA